MAYTEEQAKRDFLEQDKAWNAPRFFVLGIVSLIISIGLAHLLDVAHRRLQRRLGAVVTRRSRRARR